MAAFTSQGMPCEKKTEMQIVHRTEIQFVHEEFRNNNNNKNYGGKE